MLVQNQVMNYFYFLFRLPTLAGEIPRDLGVVLELT